MLSQVSVCPRGGGGTNQDSTPSQDWVPPPRPGQGYPRAGSGVPPRQKSRASTCYAADGMPLGVTQEDFFVLALKTLHGRIKPGTKILCVFQFFFASHRYTYSWMLGLYLWLILAIDVYSWIGSNDVNLNVGLPFHKQFLPGEAYLSRLQSVECSVSSVKMSP